MEILKACVSHPMEGVLTGEKIETAVKLYKDAKDFYESVDEGLSEDTVMYEVFQYAQEDDSYPGHLSWGLTVIQPIRVCGECNMTRGHFHGDLGCAEFYYGVEGQGLLVLMDAGGKTWAEEVKPGTLHYIKGTLAHRLVNTGDTVFKIAACWPTGAGHDYKRVEKVPFGYRIYKEGMEIKAKER